MQNRRTLVAFLLGGVLTAVLLPNLNLTRVVGNDAAADTGIYELRTYTTLPGRLPALNARFKNHTLKLFEKHGMKNILYWTPTDAERSQDTLIYVIWHKSEEAAKKSWEAFQADPDWVAARNDSEKDGKILSKVDSVKMRATDYSPQAH